MTKTEDVVAAAIAATDDMPWNECSEDSRRVYRRYARAAGQSLSERIDVLTEALELTVPIIEEERQVCFDSNVVGALRHPDLGRVIDPYALAELAKYDEALSKARSALTKEAGIHGQ